MERHTDIYTDDGKIDLYPFYREACQESDDDEEDNPIIRMFESFEEAMEERYGWKSVEDFDRWRNS